MTELDELTDATAAAVFSADFTTSKAEFAALSPVARETYQTIATQIIEAQQALLRERGVLLGPDGLIKAELIEREDIESDLSDCPYLARYESRPGHDPDATCAYGCVDEPECVTCVPSSGWPLRRPLVTLIPQDPTEEP